MHLPFKCIQLIYTCSLLAHNYNCVISLKERMYNARDIQYTLRSSNWIIILDKIRVDKLRRINFPKKSAKLYSSFFFQVTHTTILVLYNLVYRLFQVLQHKEFSRKSLRELFIRRESQESRAVSIRLQIACVIVYSSSLRERGLCSRPSLFRS